VSIIGSHSVANDSTRTAAHSHRPLPLWLHATCAAAAGLALRLFLVLRFPADAGDSAIYEELARNWIDRHVYGLIRGQALVPTDIRAPGYPAFLALLYHYIGRSVPVISLAQALVDLGTCFLVAALASRLIVSPSRLKARLEDDPQRRRIWLAALWLAATCPFVANYAAVPLTEVLATFLTAAAMLAMVGGCRSIGSAPLQTTGQPRRNWFLAGLLAGFGALVRPETPLVLLALAVVLGFHWRNRADWGKLLRTGTLIAAGLLLPLLPWAARNWITLHRVQFLAPRYATTPDEYITRGFNAWTGTWLVRFRHVYLVSWNIGSAPVDLGDIPPSAFDSNEERARVAALLDQYNETLTMTPPLDRAFAQLARERTARHPLRTYLSVPLQRALTLWFTPRVDLLPFSGHIFPLGRQWRRDAIDVSVTLLLGAFNFFYVVLAGFGFWRLMHWQRPQWKQVRIAAWLLVSFVLIRTAFFTTVETPEPRYVLECFPALLALGAAAWLRSPASSPEPRAAQGE
jgi:hypothetical protein